MMTKKILITIGILVLVIVVLFVFNSINSRPGITERELQQKFQTLKSEYEQVKAQSYDVSEIERLGREAKEAFDRGDYKKADEVLDKAIGVLKRAKTIQPTTTPTITTPPTTGIKPEELSLSRVKVAIVYERLNDARPKRTIDEQLQILKDTKADMIFRASWRWNPLLNNCSEAPGNLYQTCLDSGYTFDQQRQIIQEIKKQNPNIIIVGAIPAQKINKLEFNEVTNETFDETQTWEMALDPAKWGITSVSKDTFQKKFSGSQQGFTGYFPDVTNPDYQKILLSWAKRQTDAGFDGIWIDLLYTQAGLLMQITKDINHPAVKESYEAATKIVDEIHKYGESKGKYVYVGTWPVAMNYPYQKPNLDFITDSLKPNEVSSGKLDTNAWVKKKADIENAFDNVPIFVFIDWGYTNSPLENFVKLSDSGRINFLKDADIFFDSIGVKFVYPVHGGFITKLAYGKYGWYDSMAPEFQTYETIKELAQNKSKGG